MTRRRPSSLLAAPLCVAALAGGLTLVGASPAAYGAPPKDAKAPAAAPRGTSPATPAATPTAVETDGTPAEAEEARLRFQRGAEAFQARRYAEAALSFEAASARYPHPIALYSAGLAWQQAARPDRAADAYARALAGVGLPEDQGAKARAALQRLEVDLGTLAVTAPSGWRVQLEDGPEVETPARLHGAPGGKTLRVHRTDGATETREVTLTRGTVANLTLEEPAPEPTPPPVHVAPTPEPVKPVEPAAPPSPRGLSLRQTVGLTLAGAGVSSLVASAVLWGQASGAKDAYIASRVEAVRGQADSLETWTNVMLIGGAALTAAGAALVLWPSPSGSPSAPRVGLQPTAGGAMLNGTF